MSLSKIKKLDKELSHLYKKHNKNLLYHGWHHITFVRKKSLEFAEQIKANKFMVEAAALTHDINYIAKINSQPEAGTKLRKTILNKTGFTEEEIKKIESIITESHTANRNKKITPEGMALSDADTLFKSLPITPIIFAQKYITQNKVDIYKLAHKITSEQNPLIKQNIYFYTKHAKKTYLNWAKCNLQLWNNVIEALNDKDVKELLQLTKKLQIL